MITPLGPLSLPKYLTDPLGQGPRAMFMIPPVLNFFSLAIHCFHLPSQYNDNVAYMKAFRTSSTLAVQPQGISHQDSRSNRQYVGMSAALVAYPSVG